MEIMHTVLFENDIVLVLVRIRNWDAKICLPNGGRALGCSELTFNLINLVLAHCGFLQEKSEPGRSRCQLSNDRLPLHTLLAEIRNGPRMSMGVWAKLHRKKEKALGKFGLQCFPRVIHENQQVCFGSGTNLWSCFWWLFCLYVKTNWCLSVSPFSESNFTTLSNTCGSCALLAI